MKAAIGLCAFALLCILSETNAAGVCTPNESWTTDGCVYNVCSADGRGVSAKTCPQSRCRPGDELGWEDGDQAKPYPECCGKPICKQASTN